MNSEDLHKDAREREKQQRLDRMAEERERKKSAEVGTDE